MPPLQILTFGLGLDEVACGVKCVFVIGLLDYQVPVCLCNGFTFIYINIYIQGWIQVTRGVSLSNVTLLNIF